MPTRRILALALLAGLPGCGGLSDADAVELVQRYNERVIAAFRAGDARLIDPVTGPTDGKRLTGLIGVKLDQGITLDAEMTAFAPLRVERPKDEVLVFTEERWYYRDRRIGSGEQVGQDSTDHYFMRYHLRKLSGRWVVDHIAFEREPEVGRKEALDRGDFGAMHGVQTIDPSAGQPRGEASRRPPVLGGKPR